MRLRSSTACRSSSGISIALLPEGLTPSRLYMAGSMRSWIFYLKQRGLLDETLVVWATEFGRTPGSQNANGRDHHPFGFSVWMAGGGIKGGPIYGQTDEYGYHVAEDKCTVYYLWATVLHLLGIDHHTMVHDRLNRPLPLVDGQVSDDVIA